MKKVPTNFLSILTEKNFVLLLIVILSVLPVQAAKWYVDNTVAASGNGQSWTTAYKNFSNIVWANIKPGDFLYISGGASGSSKTYTDEWAIGASGTAGNPVTIAIDAGNTSHNGTVIFDYNALGDKATSGGVDLIGRSYVVIDGNVDGQNHISFRNLRHILERTYATCIGGWNNSSIIISHLDFVNCNNGIRLYDGTAGTGSEVKFCNFRQIRGDAPILFDMGGTTWDVSRIHDNYIEMLYNGAKPVGATAAYGGPDGVQTGNSVSIYNNTFKVIKTSVYTSTQHPDCIQFGNARYLKIYNNEFINMGDSHIDIGAWGGTNIVIQDIWIYNNVFRTEIQIDGYPQYIRLYANPGTITAIKNLKIFNNLFLDIEGSDGNWPAIIFNMYNGIASGGNPTALGIEIKNNIFYNTKGGAINIQNSTGFTSSSFDFSNNIYAFSNSTVSYQNKLYTPTQWKSSMEATAITVPPSFVSYTRFSAANDLHLKSTDTVARDKGVMLTSYFNTDKELKARPQGSAWDIGPYEYSTGVVSIPAITSPLSATGTAGSAFSYSIAASNGPTLYNASPLPAGLTINNTTGVISGTPTTAGTTNVTLSASNTAGTGTATLVITIAPVTYTVTFKVTNGTTAIAGATATFNRQTKTTNVNGQVIFTNVPQASNLTYAITAPGFKPTTVTVSVVNNLTKEVVLETNTSGIDEMNETTQVYPNPATDFINIKLNETVVGTISVISTSGTTMISENISSGDILLDVTGWAKGVYLLRIVSGQQSIVKRLIVQ